MQPVVLHIPHASISIPADVRQTFELTDEELSLELLRMTDRHTDKLFGGCFADVPEVLYPVSRLVVDPERFEDDEQEPASMVGMGVIYSRTSDGKVLRPEVSRTERKALLDRFYRPHHRRLTAAVNCQLEQQGACLVVDCHSFPTLPVPFEPYPDCERPDICIGTDSFHTPPGLRDAFVTAFKTAFTSVGVDRPFAGALVPPEHYAGDRRVSAIMVEIGRWLYMNENTGERSPAFPGVRDRIHRCLRAAVGSFCGGFRA